MKNVLSVLLLVIFVFFNANAVASPNSLTYQGRIIKSDGTALEYSNVSFLFEVTSEDGSCVIYREQRDGVNMVNSKGLFDVAIGSGTRLFPDTGSNPTYTLSQAFGNGVSHSCFGSGSWTASVDSYRKLKVQFHDGNGWQVITPDSIIRSVPFALTAKSATQLGDKTINDFVLKSNAPGSACTAGQVVSWDGTNFSCVTDAGGSGVISDVLAGTGIAVSGTTSKTIAVTFGTTAGTVAQGNDSRIANALQSSTVFAGDVSGTATSMSVDKIKGVSVDSTAPTTGQVLRYDGAKWAAATPNAGTVTSVGVSVPSFLSASGGPITSSGTISISLASQTGNTVFAAPNGSSGAPTFRTLSIADIFSSIGGLSFLNTTPSCAAGSALTYISATDRIQCASIAVDTANIADNAITTAKIADGAVTAVKLGSDVGAWGTSSGNVYRTTGRVGIGTSTPSEIFEVSAENNWPTVASVAYSNLHSPAMVGYRYRGTKASPTIVNSGDLAYISQGWGYDGTALKKVASIAYLVDATPGANDMPGAIAFYTTNDGSAVDSEKMRITNDGKVGIGTASPVISLDLSSKTDAIYFPKGTTAQQPSSPAAGMIRYNTDNNAAEFYNGTSWVNLAAITSGGTMTNVSTITGGASGINISAGGTNQNVTLTASGTGTVTTGSVMTITNSTASTAYNNGALVVSGGVGVSGNINSNGNIYSKGLQVDGTIIKSGSGDLVIKDQAGTSERDLQIYKNGNMASFRSDSSADSDKLGTFAFLGASTYFESKVGIGSSEIYYPLQVASSYPKTDTVERVISKFTTSEALTSNPFSFSISSIGGATLADRAINLQTSDHNIANGGVLALQANAGKVGIGTIIPEAKLHITNTLSGAQSDKILFSISDLYNGGSNGQLLRVLGGTSGINFLSNWNALSFGARNDAVGTIKQDMTILTNGNVGIGTASPAAKLEVNGSIKQGKYIQNFYHFFAGSAWQSGSDRRYLRIDTNIPWGDGPYINLFIRGMHYDAMKSIDLQISWYMFGSGFHGPQVTSKGTSTPAVSLANESGKISILLDVGASGRWYWSSFKFDAQYENVSDPTIFDGWSAAEAPFTGAATGIVGPLTPNNGPMTFGNYVGIGTTSPSVNLDAFDYTGSSERGIRSTTVAGNPGGVISVRGGRGTSSAPTALQSGDYLGWFIGDGYNGSAFSSHSTPSGMSILATENWTSSANGTALRFLTVPNGGTNGVVRMQVGQDGNVGIGTTTPAGKLHSIGGIYTSNPSIALDAGGAATTASKSGILFGSNHSTNNAMFWMAPDSTDGNRINIGTGNTFTDAGALMTILAVGEVGIGTRSPNYKLDVVGDINASGSVRAAGVALSSDARFKRNIASITNPLGKVLALRGVEYDWKTDQYPERKFNDRHQIGVIAQEVEKVFPEVVDTDKQGYKSVNYPALVAPVIGAIKELYAKLVGVDARVAELERENALLKAQNQELKNDVDQIKKSLGIK